MQQVIGRLQQATGKRTAAKASWLAALAPIPVRIVIQSSMKDAGPDGWLLGLVSVGITIACCIIGISAGAYALAKVRSVGRDGVLTSALIGTLVNAAFLVLMIVAFAVGVGR